MEAEAELETLLKAEPGDARFAVVDALITRGDVDEVAEAAVRWCADGDPAVQSIGVDVLGTLVDKRREYLPILMEQATAAVDSPSEDVRWSVAVALRHKNDWMEAPWDARIATLLLGLRLDSDSDVRYQVVMALPSFANEPAPDDPIVCALLEALEDADPKVRDWAAFGLGVQLNVDTPEIRDALFRRLDDPEADTAGEAAVGLARRGDPRVFDVIASRLAGDDAGNLWVEAAGELGDARLVPFLEAWLDDGSRPRVLVDALARCRGDSGPSLEEDAESALAFANRPKDQQPRPRKA